MLLEQVPFDPEKPNVPQLKMLSEYKINNMYACKIYQGSDTVTFRRSCYSVLEMSENKNC